MKAPIEYYNEQKTQFTTLLAQVEKKSGNVAMARLWLVLGTIAGYIFIYSKDIPWHWWYLAAPIVIFLWLVKLFVRLNDEKENIKLDIKVIDNEIQALAGNYSAFDAGIEHINSLHPFSYDLDLFGKHSIFQMLCRTVTTGGGKLLSEKLANLTLQKNEITDRQQIIQELTQMPDFLLQFRVRGMRVKEEPKDMVRLREWLQSENVFLEDKLVRAASMIMPVLSLGCIVYSAISGSVFNGLFLVVITNWIINGRYAKKIKAVATQVGNTALLIGKYEGLIHQMGSQEFKHEQLKASAATAAQSLAQITKFKKQINLFDSRNNGMVGPLMNTLALFDLGCLVKLETWKKAHSTVLLNALDVIIAADVQVSCATYAFNFPANIYPQLNESSNEIVAKNLIHPLLSPNNAIGNDFSLGKKEQFYLLTGANMTGKSTFIRTIGVSLVCGNLGLPVRAQEVSLPLVDLYTSMRVTDSVQDDISYFKAELNRIKSIMTVVKVANHPYLILLDEPLRGTNSTDKQEGTRSIVENLLTFHAIGIVATHDTVLCDMEQHFDGQVSNYHFESKVAANALTFDFKLKTGGSTSNNATILMKQMGILK